MWLIFVYGTAPEKSDTADIHDPVVELTIAHVPTGSWPRFLACVLAAYIFFGYGMYLVLDDFAWYTKMRHEFLRLKEARNYAVFIRNIPPSYRNNLALEQFMKSCFSSESVLEARVAVTTSQLAKVEGERDVVLAKLEHALAECARTGIRPTHGLLGASVDSIEAYETKLNELNEQVSKGIADIEEKIRAMLSTVSGWNAVRNVVRSGITFSNAEESSHNGDLTSSADRTSLDEGDTDRDKPNAEESTCPSSASHTNGTFDTVSLLAADTAGRVGSAIQTVGNVATGAVGGAAALITGQEDGIAHPAGFVVFSKLSTANAALQMVHHPTPFAMEISEAPDPKDVNWNNISRTHESLQLGKLSSLAMTVGLCLLWTIPMTFIATLSSVDALRNKVKFVDEMLNFLPFLMPVFEIVAPLLVVIANSLLPTILEIITSFEGPISGAVAHASLFAKLAGFMVIQTFFVSAISGSIVAVSTTCSPSRI